MFDEEAVGAKSLLDIYHRLSLSYQKCLLEYAEYLFMKHKRAQGDKEK